MNTPPDLGTYPVAELRRYTIQAPERGSFARYFETYFPEAFQQLGAMILGHFLERDDPGGFTWIRGFRSMDERAAVNHAFYEGPLWAEHRSTMNDRLIDHTDVLLLQPLTPERGIPVLPAVDPVREEKGAQGVVVAQVFPVKPGALQAFAEMAEGAFAAYRAAGAREVGVLVTLDVENNFPRLPFRTDGPYLVWLGVLPDDATLERPFRQAAAHASERLAGSEQLRGAPEISVLDPGHRSRLRWLP